MRKRQFLASIISYTDSLDQYRQYLRDQKGIPFDKVGFHCFTKEMIYGFCVWLRDSQNKAVNTINLRLSAIRSFLCYCSEEDVALSELYLKAKSIHRFKGKIDPKLEYLTPDQLETVFAAPDTKTWNGRRNQYFMIHAYEDSIGLPSDGFWKNKAGLPRIFITRRYSPLHCFRPGFSVRGSRRGSTGDFRSCSHVTFCVAGINKTFLEKVIAFRKIQGLVPRERETELGL